MLCYFAVSLAIRRFSNVLKESRYRNKFSIIKLTCNLFLFLGCGSHLANVTVNRAKAVLDTSLKISEHDNWYMPGSDAKHFWYVKDVVIPILLIIITYVTRAYVTCRLDNCNSLLLGSPKYMIQKLQRVQNCAARLVAGQPRAAHILPVLKELHSLPMEQRITF